jgi:hypothetical protein
MTHWITQRANEDRLYFSQGPTLWGDLKDALKYCVAEYHKQYVPSGTQILFEACAGGNPNCVRLRRQYHQNGMADACEVQFDISKLSVIVTEPSITITLGITSQGTDIDIGSRAVELLHKGKAVDVAEASKIGSAQESDKVPD